MKSKLIPIEQNNQRVLLTFQIAERYGASKKQISENFNANKERYIEGKHLQKSKSTLSLNRKRCIAS